MQQMAAALLLGLAWAANAKDEGWAVQSISGEGVTQAADSDHVDPADMDAWLRDAEATAKRLGLRPDAKAAVALKHPLLQMPGLASRTRIGISNFVDLNAAFPNQLRDYACGTRTYDTAAGYNHAGIDYFLWPFPWQSMAQESVAATAAAAGTIVQRVDVNVDRSCSFNAVTQPNRLVIAHDNGEFGVYLHFKRAGLTAKTIGQRVEAGEFLGWIGSSGISTGPHLHFELRSGSQANAPVIDPNQGQCNAVPSRWELQPAYREPRLEMVSLHSAPPEFYFESCSDNELPQFERHFEAGDTFYVSAYYADQPAGKESSIVLRGPDGAELSRQLHAPSTSDLDGRDAYNASYWLFRFTVPAGAAPGLYSAEVSYEGLTRRQTFAVGGPIYAASGVWHNPAQNGHGFTTEVIDLGGKAHLLAAWFVYLDGEPRWMSGLGEIVGDTATVPLSISSGGQFLPAYDPAQAPLEPWGQLRFSFESENTATVQWSSDYPGFNDGELALSRLVGIAAINRDDENTGMRACASGTWHVPEQGGHGVQTQVIEAGGQRILVATWYVYHEGKQIWLTGTGPIVGKRAVVNWNRTRGAQFLPAFDPASVVSEPWGTGTFELVDPQRLRMQWQSNLPGFGTGSLDLSRLTEMLTASCL